MRVFMNSRSLLPLRGVSFDTFAFALGLFWHLLHTSDTRRGWHIALLSDAGARADDQPDVGDERLQGIGDERL